MSKNYLLREWSLSPDKGVKSGLFPLFVVSFACVFGRISPFLASKPYFRGFP